MKRSKFTESQIGFALRHADTGVKVEEEYRKKGISEARLNRDRRAPMWSMQWKS